jgi:hypothetical protein
MLLGQLLRAAARDAACPAKGFRVLKTLFIALAGAVAALLPASAIAAQPASAQTCQGWHVVTGDDGLQYTVNPNNWGGGNTCIEDYGTQAGFTVESQTAPNDGSVLAYPDSSIGCSWGGSAYCTNGWVPEQVSTANPSESLSMTFTGSSSDIGDFSNDIWFWSPGALNPDTELMIYFDEQNLAIPKNAVQVRVNGVRYWYKTYMLSNASYSWRYMVFERVTPLDTVNNLPLAPFFSYAEGQGVLSGSDYLQEISAGFEESQGGTGLQLNYFSVSP